jgi:outer membrane protein TolC
MKKVIIFTPLFLFASLLSDLKIKEFNLDKLKSVKDSKETKYSWINPVMLKYSYQKDNTLGVSTTTKLFSVSINQPIFKTGAIYYSIKYAKVAKKYNLDTIELQKRELIKTALDLAYDYRITKLNKKILEYKIRNAEIDVERKKEAFLSGSGDSSQLDNSILNLNNLKLSLQDVISNLNNIKYSFSNISDLDIESVDLPKLRLISKDRYLNENLELLSQKNFKKIKKYLYKMQLGNQLLNISVNGSWNYKDYKNKLQNDKQNYYIVGISASLPLDINAKTRVEKTKIDYLKSKLLVQDKKRELLNTYMLILNQIKTLREKIRIYNENIKIYDNLIKTTDESIKAGSATYLDLEILKNSKNAAVLNKQIINYQIQKQLLNLYYKLISFKD